MVVCRSAGVVVGSHPVTDPVLRTRVMRQPPVPVGRAVAMAPGEVEHGAEQPRWECDGGGECGRASL